MRFSRVLSLTVAGFVMTSCASAPPATSRVTLESDGSAWLATWQLAAPARALRFDRPAAFFRAGTFEVLTPGYAIAKDGDVEVLRTTGEPQRTIRVRFPEHTAHLPKEYEFFQKFSDGSVSIYTGHLLAHPEECDDCLVRDFRFIPSRGSNVIVGGARASGPLEWRDTKGEGTYAYFGSLDPVETADLIAIVDPGLPDWLEEASRDAFPRLFDLYTERLGASLPERPTVLFNYVPSTASGFSSGGGTLPGLIELTVEGTEWDEKSDEGLIQLFHFLAHEAAHLWNGQMVNYPGSADAWMHEGSADALAERALLEFGVIDERRFLDYQTAALNACRRGLGSAPLRDAATRGAFDLYYACGNVIALAMEARSGDLFAIWKTLIERALRSEARTYQPGDLTAAWEIHGATAADTAALKSLVETASSPDAIVTMLRESGVEVAATDDVPQPYGQMLARDALLHILAARCTGRYGFRMERDGLRLDDPLECPGLTGGALVTALGTRDVIREGHRAWDAIQQACGSTHPVRVTLADATGPREIDVPCRQALPTRPPYVRIESRPRR